jgi:hypothetical protein
MRKAAFLPCIPTRGTKVPAHPDWLHEIKGHKRPQCYWTYSPSFSLSPAWL